MPRRRIVGAAAAALTVPLLLLFPLPSANAENATAPAAVQAAPGQSNDIRELTRKDFTYNGAPVAVPASYQPRAAASSFSAAAVTPPVGTVRPMLALDDFNGVIYLKNYTLRGAGTKIEVWVANDTAFPAGDCRNSTPGTTEITDAHVALLINEFDNNMFPKETAAFSTPPDRDGTNALIPFDFTGAGDKTVALIDNVRDDNFFDFPAAPTYIAGFFFSLFNEFMDRNVMTVDAFDWLHRTGANPPDNPTSDPCTSRPGRPFLYEGVFAHEWQHLLHYYTDPFETTWVNEGLSDFAQTLTGYVDGRLTIDQKGADSHIYCYQGFGIVQTPFNPNPRDCGGAENSLNIWDEGIPAAVLADYGHTYSLMLYLFDRFGTQFMSALHQDGDLQGLASLDAHLDAAGVSNMYGLLHDFQSSTLLDRIVGNPPFGLVLGTSKSRVTTASLNSTVNLANPQSYDDPGAAPNGSDYVPLQNANGQFLRGKDLRSLKFEGAKTLPPLPLLWSVVSNDPDRNGNAVLFSGNTSNLDAAAVIPASVPAGSPTLTFLAKYGAEAGFDYGYIGVSTDGGASYTLLTSDRTVEAPLGPGLNGTTVGFEPHTFDLTPYAGQNVLLSFRYVSDGSVNEGGLKLDDIAVGGTVISDGSNLSAFKSPTQIRAIDVNNFNVKVIGIDPAHHVAWQLYDFNGKFSISLNRIQLALLSLFPQVVVMVAYDEPTEQVQQYAPYTLTVNGVVQPGGA
jgi:hypothetical protein